MATTVVIQSRLNSSRLPGKALMNLAGYPLIELVARRAQRPLPNGSRYDVVVATSDEPYDALIANTLRTAGVRVFQGDLDDVLGRFVAATAELADDDLVVRLTGDNPLADADLVAELIAATEAAGAEYGRVDIEAVPEGLGAEVFPARLLRLANRESVDPYDHEHVTPWIRRHAEELLFAPAANPVQCAEDINGYRATIDCLDDFDRVSRAFLEVGDPVAVPWPEVMAQLVAQTPPQSALVDVEPRRSQHVLSLRGLSTPAAAREAARVAVRSGISHALGGLSDLPAWRWAIEPALKQRLKLYLCLDAPTELSAAYAGLEREFLDAVLVPVARLSEWLPVFAAAPIGEWGVIVSEPDEWAVALEANPALVFAESLPSAETALDLIEMDPIVIGYGEMSDDGSVIAHPSFDQVVVDLLGS